MKYIKLNPEAHKNHRPPHVPWYIEPDITGVIAQYKVLIFRVTEFNDKCYSVAELVHPDRSRFTPSVSMYINKNDAIDVPLSELYSGILNKEEGEDLDEHIKRSREEWD